MNSGDKFKADGERQRYLVVAASIYHNGHRYVSVGEVEALVRQVESTAREEGFRDGRLAGLEEAAQVAEDEDGRFTWAGQDSNVRLLQQCASEIAAAIRALKEKQP